MNWIINFGAIGAVAFPLCWLIVHLLAKPGTEIRVFGLAYTKQQTDKKLILPSAGRKPNVDTVKKVQLGYVWLMGFVSLAVGWTALRIAVLVTGPDSMATIFAAAGVGLAVGSLVNTLRVWLRK